MEKKVINESSSDRFFLGFPVIELLFKINHHWFILTDQLTKLTQSHSWTTPSPLQHWTWAHPLWVCPTDTHTPFFLRSK